VAATNDAVDADIADRLLVVSRLIDAPRDLVFQAWTRQEHVARWWGPEGFVTTFCEMDIREGGSFRLCMRSPAGTYHWKQGVYREILPPERIVFTFAWEDVLGNPGHELLTTVTLADQGGRTLLTLRQEVFQTAVDCDDHRQGWTSCLASFAAYTITRSGI
jgi:uncharacterized protein YndB with AHSA1/START domain